MTPAFKMESGRFLESTETSATALWMGDGKNYLWFLPSCLPETNPFLAALYGLLSCHRARTI